MIILYDKFKTNDFDRNDLVLRNATKCEVAWEKNGQFQIDLVYPIIPGDTAWQSIVKGAIVKCPVPHQQDQLFRLNTPTKKMDENGTYFYIEATGYHITYDLAANFLEDVRPTGKTGIEAGEYILGNTQYSHPFNWIGDIATVGTAYYVRQNPIDALIGDKDNAYKNVWGGELVRDNFTIGMMNQAGENRGVAIRYSKNLTGFEQSADDSNMITRAMPYITDDSTSTDDDSKTSTDSSITPVITLPEKYVDSPKINDYANIYVKDVEVTLTDAQKNLSTDQKYQVMRDYANNLYENENVDIPVYSYSVNFLELCKTEEYKDYAVLEEVHPYDFVVIKALDIDVIAELVGYTYDSITKLYEEVTLGNVRNDFIRSNQKSLFQISQQNQNNIKILQAQMGDIPGTILNVASATTSGGNNLFDHAVLEDKYASEWTSTGATVVEDDSLHDTDKVWKLPPNASLSKSDILVNPNNYRGKQLMFSLQAKYSNLTITDSGQYNVPNQTNVLLGALDAVIKRCLVDTTGTTWTFNSNNTGIISERIGVTAGTAITISNPQNYTYTIHAWDNKDNQLADFTTGPIPANVFQISVEILQSMSPLSLIGFSIFETNAYTAQAVSFLYANKTDCDWQTQEQNFQLMTEHPSDVIEQINFRASNGDANGTAYIGAFMINTGIVRSDFSQSSNDTVQTLRAHQIITDYIQAKQADIDELHATNATVQNLSATYATITNLNAANANIQTLTTNKANVTDLTATNATITNLKASVGNIMDLTTNTLKANIITANNIATGTITAGSGIIDTGAIGTAQIADGSITDGKIVGLTANKITAGTIDASQITVTNLNAANITVGTINGQQIAPGAITAKQLADGAVGTSQLTTAINNTINAAYSTANTANSTANTALTTANGKNKTFYGSSAPTGMVSGDLWMKSVSGGISPMQYNGSSWVSVTDVAVANASSAASIAQTTATNAATAASNAQSSVNNIQIGGTNLVGKFNSRDPITVISNNSKSGWGYKILAGNGGWGGSFGQLDLKANTDYTISFIAWNDSSDSSNISYMDMDLIPDNLPQVNPNITTTPSKYSFIFNSTSTAMSACILRFFNDRSANTANVYITDIKLEEGNKATDWTPALADVQGQIDSTVSNIQTINTVTIPNTLISANSNAQGYANTAQSNAVNSAKSYTDGQISTVNSSISSVQTTANGKNTIYYQTAQPSGGTYKTGDLWFDTDDGYRMYGYNGSAWTASQFGTDAIASASITNALIADATIQSGKIANLDAGKITTGTLDANRIGANTITGTMIASQTIVANNIAANVITASQIAANTITSTQIASRTITAGNLVAGTITANEIASNTITGNKIQGQTILASNLVAGTLTSSSGVFGSIDANILTTGTLNAARIAAGSIDATKLVTGCITSASGVIGALDAGAITTGTLDANRIGANTITTDKLLIGDFTNYVDDSSFENSSATGVYSIVTNIVHEGTKALKLSATTIGYVTYNLSHSTFEVKSGDQFYCEFWAYRDSASQAIKLNIDVLGYDGVHAYDSNNAVTAQTTATNATWVKYTGTTTVTKDGFANIQFKLPTSSGLTGNWYLDDVVVRRVSPGVLIQDGAITANKIVSSAITTDKIAAGAVQAGNILSNTITANQIAGQTITATQIASRTITADRIVTNAITANEIAANTITGNKIAANTIAAGNIVANTITASQIATNTITAGNIATGTITASSACIASLNANWLTTGTLNANLVSVINLNADNINAGSLSANRISGGTLTLGGSGNGNGLALVKNSSSQEVVRLDANGLTITLQQVNGLLANAFNIKAYDGTQLMNIDGDGFFNFAGVMSVTNSQGTIDIESTKISFNNQQTEIGNGNGDGATWGTYNSYIASWNGLALGSRALTNGVFNPTFMFNCRTGEFTALGAKHRAVKTENYGVRCLNAYETPDCLFGDIGRNKLIDGQCIINIDPIFLETVNTNLQYEVKTWAYGNGNVWVETDDMYPSYFIVHGSEDIDFGYEIVAKQKDYEAERLKAM